MSDCFCVLENTRVALCLRRELGSFIMIKNRHIFFFLCMNFGFIIPAFASHLVNKNWKTSGEYLESLYFNSLQESLKESKPKHENAASIKYLKQAFIVYHQQAKDGDADAQFRLGTIYEKSVPSQIENAKHWYQQAAAQGHRYAADRLKGARKPNEQAKCELYGNLLLADPTLNPELLFHVESLALLGHEDCMLALGKAGSFYWLQRAVLTPSSSALQGEALFELGLAMEEKRGSDCKSVISLMERASRYLSPEAEGWLAEHRNVDGMSAYVSFLNSRKQMSFAAYLTKSLIQNSSSWNEGDRYKAIASETTATAYSKNLNQALQDLQVDDDKLVFEVIGSIAEALVRETNLPQADYVDFIDSSLSLYEKLGDKKNEGLGVSRLFLQFLRTDTGNLIDKEKQFLLLNKSLRALDVESLKKLNQEQDAIGLVVSLLQPTKELLKVEIFLMQLERALSLRRILLPIGDVEKLDFAFRNATEILSQDEAVLKIVLQVARSRKSSDLFLLFFKKLFANELAQLDILMQVEDLLSGVSFASNDKNQAYKMLEFLAVSQENNISLFKESYFDGFPKLKLWQESGFLLENRELGFGAALFADSLLSLQAYAQAAKNFQKTGLYFMSYELASTLSSKHIDAVKNGFESRLSRLSELKQDFKQNRNEKEFVEDAQVSKILFEESLENSLTLKMHQLKQYVLELLATQETLAAQLSYAGLHGERKAALQTSNGLKIFQKVAGVSDDFTVSPADAKISSAFIRLDNSMGFSHRSIELRKNDVLNIQVSGEWSPTCALKHSGMVKNPDGILIGSEGFRTHVSTGDNLVIGNDQRTSISRFSQESKAQGGGFDWLKAVSMFVGGAIGFVTGGPPGMIAGAAMGATFPSPFSYSSSFQKTSGTSESSDSSDYKQSSHFSSNTAAFQSGMRLIHTPYPQLPAGAYVAIVVSREQSNLGEVTKQLVLQAHNSIVAAQDSQVLFVVNDCNDGHSEKGSLAVHLQKLQPASNEVNKLVDAMEKSLRVFAKKGEALVKEGGDLSSRIETLKADVIADLQLNSIVDFMSQPTLRSVFLQWLHHEADNIVRKARIAELIRNIYSVKMEIEGIQNQRKTNSQHENQLSSRLSRLVRSTKHLVIYDSILEVAQYATQFLMPILQLYYPKNPEFLSKNTHGPRIVDAQKMSDLEMMAETVEHFSQQLLRGLGAELISATTAEYVMVRIPRPGSMLTEAQRKLVPVIAEDRAQIFWDHLFRKDLNLESWGVKLEFEDLYQDVRQASLFSHQEAPIIIDMALLLGHDDIFATEYLQTQFPLSAVDMVVGREQVFPLQQGPKRFFLKNDKLRKYKISLGFMSAQQLASDAVSQIRNEVVLNLNTAKGLSPFSAFSFAQDRGALLENLQKDLGREEDGYPGHLTDIFIVMKVVSSNGYDSIKWLNSKD